jgi:CPA1 family monovalent cation:H+ antiporter
VPVIVAVLAILFSRAVIVYSLTWFHGRSDSNRRIPMSFRHVMYWGGLRGAISLALALTLSGRLFGPSVVQELRVMTFGVVLFTLLVQGTTIERLIRRLRLATQPAQRIEQQRRQALIHAKRAGRRELERLRSEGILFRDIWESMDAVYGEEIDQHKLALRDHLQAFPELEQEMLLQAREDVLKAERSAITDAARRGLIAEEVHDEVIRATDKRMAALELIKANRGVESKAAAKDSK